MDDKKMEDQELDRLQLQLARRQMQLILPQLKRSLVLMMIIIAGYIFFEKHLMILLFGDPEIAYQKSNGSYVVEASHEWVNTKVRLTKGEVVKIATTGVWTADAQEQEVFFGVGAEGYLEMMQHVQCISDEICPLLTQWLGKCEKTDHKICAPLMQLMGKVGDISFAIGDTPSFTSPANGELFLAPNDFQHLTDNMGQLEVTLTRSAP